MESLRFAALMAICLPLISAQAATKQEYGICDVTVISTGKSLLKFAQIAVDVEGKQHNLLELMGTNMVSMPNRIKSDFSENILAVMNSTLADRGNVLIKSQALTYHGTGLIVRSHSNGTVGIRGFANSSYSEEGSETVYSTVAFNSFLKIGELGVRCDKINNMSAEVRDSEKVENADNYRRFAETDE